MTGDDAPPGLSQPRVKMTVRDHRRVSDEQAVLAEEVEPDSAATIGVPL
jgi:hypothetical protein